VGQLLALNSQQEKGTELKLISLLIKILFIYQISAIRSVLLFTTIEYCCLTLLALFFVPRVDLNYAPKVDPLIVCVKNITEL
jgi:hypothetical protein